MFSKRKWPWMGKETRITKSKTLLIKLKKMTLHWSPVSALKDLLLGKISISPSSNLITASRFGGKLFLRLLLTGLVRGLAGRIEGPKRKILGLALQGCLNCRRSRVNLSSVSHGFNLETQGAFRVHPVRALDLNFPICGMELKIATRRKDD